MKRGPIFITFSFIVKIFYYLNFVEGVKSSAKLLTKKKSNIERNIHIATDIYILLKWTVIIWFWIAHKSGIIFNLIAYYLIITNLFTYFYYHVWYEPLQYSRDRIRNRLINLFLAFNFSIFTYSYLIYNNIPSHFNVEQGYVSFTSILLFSISNSLFSSYSKISPSDNLGFIISISESLITFIFLSIILAKSLIQPTKN